MRSSVGGVIAETDAYRRRGRVDGWSATLILAEVLRSTQETPVTGMADTTFSVLTEGETQRKGCSFQIIYIKGVTVHAQYGRILTE